MPSPTTLPARVDSSILARYLTAEEPVVLVKLVSVGNTSPYDFRDAKGSRSYVFRWDLKAGGHVLRVPLSLWQANKAQMAHDIMDQRRLPNAIVVTVEMPVKAPETTSPTKKGATETTNEGDAQNVVGLSQASQPTVAPASESPANDPLPQEEAPGVNTASLTDDKLAELAFDNVEQPKRIKALAAILGVEEEALRAVIESTGSKVELAKAGWVRRKES
jgi:hypothetical protein